MKYTGIQVKYTRNSVQFGEARLTGRKKKSQEKYRRAQRHLTNLKGHGHFFEELVLELDLEEHVGISHIDKGVSGGGGNI